MGPIYLEALDMLEIIIFYTGNTDSRTIETIHGILGNADNVSELRRLVKGNLFYNLFFLCVICLIKKIILITFSQKRNMRVPR